MNTVKDLRKAVMAVFLATDEESVAQDLSDKLKWAADRIEELEDQVLALNQVIQKQRTRIRAFGHGWQEGDRR